MNKKLASTFAALALIAGLGLSPASAVDNMSSTDAPLFSAFISGWFNQKTGHVTVDLNEYARNVANVRSWCATNPGETVFAGLQRATGTSGR